MSSITYLTLILFFSCHSNQPNILAKKSEQCTTSQGILIGTRFKSFEALQEVLTINYDEEKSPTAYISHQCNGRIITSTLESGVSEKDFERAWQGGIFDKLSLACQSPYTVVKRNDLVKVYMLSRRRGEFFGAEDKSFYDIALAMMDNIEKEETDAIYQNDFSEKGFINTFNHLVAQSFITTIYSETFADFIADAHERARMPELMTGEFTNKQIEDLDNGPLDNYVDIINNEWGQELGKKLKQKYQINSSTKWSPNLLTQYLNDIQSYCAHALRMGFKPFKESDEMVKTFSKKINAVLENDFDR